MFAFSRCRYTAPFIFHYDIALKRPLPAAFRHDISWRGAFRLHALRCSCLRRVHMRLPAPAPSYVYDAASLFSLFATTPFSRRSAAISAELLWQRAFCAFDMPVKAPRVIRAALIERERYYHIIFGEDDTRDERYRCFVGSERRATLAVTAAPRAL